MSELRMESSNGPMGGVRVVDLSCGIAGAYATKLLADAGADVIKVEPQSGDPLRRWKSSARMGMSPPLPQGEDGALFRFLHAGKRSVVLDLDTEQGKGELLALATTADLIFESFSPGRMRLLGLGVDALRASRPTVCLVSITPWGQDGPWAHRAATEFTLQAQMGCMAEGGYPDRPPVAVGGFLGEYACGAMAATAALAAYRTARAIGRGEHVDVSMAESMLCLMNIARYMQRELQPGFTVPRYVEVPAIEPTKDGWVGLCTLTGQQWKDFALLIERPDLGDDAELLNGLIRGQDERVRDAVRQWTREHTVSEIIEMAMLLRIPVAPIGNGKTVLLMDHLQERGEFVENPHGFLQPRVPYRIGNSESRMPAAAPVLGRDTGAIRAESTSRVVARRRFDASDLSVSDEITPPLAGLRVLDLTAFWYGPLATWTLANLGADVVKVESVQRPDGMRFAAANNPTRGDLWECSHIFHSANAGKRGITLNLDSKEGIALVKRLIAGADVLVENFSPRVMENFGLGWDVVREINPDLIMVRLPAFGLDGPWRDRTGFAMNVEQASGIAWMTGYPDLPPMAPRPTDATGAIHAVFAMLLALEARADGGGGRLVEVPLMDVALNVAAEQVVEYTAYGAVLERTGNRSPRAVPQGVYRCAGGSLIAVSVETLEQWESLVKVLGSPEWVSDPALSTEQGRWHAHDAIDEGLDRWFGQRRLDDALEQLSARGVPVAEVRNPAMVHPNPQLESRGFFAPLRHTAVGLLHYPRLPVRFSGHYLPLRTAAPALGQHNSEVLHELLGLSGQEIAELRTRHVIGERPLFL